MIGCLNKAGLIEAGYKRIGQLDGKSIYRRVVPQFDINDGMAHFHNRTRNRQVTEFAFLDDNADKVEKVATRRVGEYGESAKAVDRSTKTEFNKANVKDFYIETTFAHYTDSHPVHMSPIEGKLPGTIHVAEHTYLNPLTELDRRTDFVTFNTNGEILQRGHVRVPHLPADPKKGLKKVWLYDRGMGTSKLNNIQSSYTSHIVAENGNYIRSVKGSGTIYTPEAQVEIPKYTSFNDIKTDGEFYTKEFNA